jgi:hypothetical protein
MGILIHPGVPGYVVGAIWLVILVGGVWGFVGLWRRTRKKGVK